MGRHLREVERLSWITTASVAQRIQVSLKSCPFVEILALHMQLSKEKGKDGYQMPVKSLGINHKNRPKVAESPYRNQSNFKRL